MSRKHYWLLVVLAIGSGVISGAVTSWLITSKDLLEVRAVKAEGFYLVDNENNCRGIFRASSDGRVSLGLVDNNGKPRISLWLSKDGEPYLKLSDGIGSLIALRTEYNGNPCLEMFDKDGLLVWQTPQVKTASR